MNKIDLICIYLALGLAIPGQILWAIIFWNNDELWSGHWVLAGLGITVLFLWLPYFLWRITKT